MKGFSLGATHFEILNKTQVIFEMKIGGIQLIM